MTSFDLAGLGDVFFVIVGGTGTVEGSYGLASDGAQRPEDTFSAGCDLPQELPASCGVAP